MNNNLTPLQIGVSENAGTIKFGTDPVNTPLRDWPSSFDVVHSFNLLGYDDILDYFTNEDKWFSLTPVERISGAGQRYVGKIDAPYGEGKVDAMMIGLDGITDAATMSQLVQKAQEAGHMMMPKYQFGEQGSTITIFIVIPQYELKYGQK